MLPQQLHSEIDTQDELEQLFEEHGLDEESYEIHEYSFPEFLDSVRGYNAQVVRVQDNSYDASDSVESEADRFLEWAAVEEEVLEAAEAEVYTDLGGTYGVDVGRAVLVDGVYPEEQMEVDHDFYDTLPQYFTVFGLVDDEKEESEFYYKFIHPNNIVDEKETSSFSNQPKDRVLND